VNFNLYGDMVPSSVSVVATDEMVEVARIPTCIMPHGSRLNPQGTKHYSACMMDDMLVEIDTRKLAVSRHFFLRKGQERGMDGPVVASTTLYPSSAPSVYGDFPMPKPKRQYDAMELTLNRRFASNWFAGASYTLSRLYGNYSGLANSDEISTPTTNVTSATAQQSGGSIARPGSNAHIAWDSDVILWDANGNLDVRGPLATERPHVIKLFGSYVMPAGTTIGGFFYAGSGTPVTTVVNDGSTLYAPMVNGRADLGRTPFLTRTDLLVSHDFQLTGARRLRLEGNIINLFNQKTASHIFNFLNKGAPGGGSQIGAAAIDLSNTDITKPYDYNALIRQTQLGEKAFDPRYGREDLWNAGLQGQFSVKFIF